MRVLNVLLLVLFASSASARVGSVERVLEAVDGVIPDEYVVVLDEGVEPRGLVNALKNSGKAEILHTYKIVNGFAVRMNLNALENALKNQDGVTIYPNDVATAISVQSPVGSWGIDRVDQTTGTNNQYSYLRDGTDVDVYILDTGIKTDHPDFGGRASHGYDATGEGNFDGNGHGTHVAGTVGGTDYGIAKNVNLISVKVLDSSGSGTLAGVLAGIDWVVAQARPKGSVANMSLGTTRVIDALDNAVNNAVAAGVVMVVAGGNSNTLACGSSPASAASAITVGATAQNDARASFSNFGSCLDIFAPGVNIVSCALNGQSIAYSGTSMASPHVAGVAALLLQEDPSLTPALLAQKILTGATSGVVIGAGSGSPNLMLYTGAITGPTTPTISLAPTTSAPAPAPTAAPVLAPLICAAPKAFCNIGSDCCSNSCRKAGINGFCR